MLTMDEQAQVQDETQEERLERLKQEQTERIAGFHGGAEKQGTPIPGQQTIDGEEEPPASNGAAAGSVEGLVIEGPAQLSIYSTGGKDPQRAKLTVKAVSIELEPGTTFPKGAVFAFAGTAVVVGAADVDKLDKATGMVVECKRQVTAQVNDLWLTED